MLKWLILIVVSVFMLVVSLRPDAPVLHKLDVGFTENSLEHKVQVRVLEEKMLAGFTDSEIQVDEFEIRQRILREEEHKVLKELGWETKELITLEHEKTRKSIDHTLKVHGAYLVQMSLQLEKLERLIRSKK